MKCYITELELIAHKDGIVTDGLLNWICWTRQKIDDTDLFNNLKGITNS